MKKFILILGFILYGMIIMSSCNFIGDGMDTAQKEYAPSAMLNKYEWFQAQSQFITKSAEDVKNYKTTLDSNLNQYTKIYGDPKSWDILTKSNYQESYNKAKSVYDATVQTYNKLVADYNTQSSKFNWQTFNANKANLPPTYTEIH